MHFRALDPPHATACLLHIVRLCGRSSIHPKPLSSKALRCFAPSINHPKCSSQPNHPSRSSDDCSLGYKLGAVFGISMPSTKPMEISWKFLYESGRLHSIYDAQELTEPRRCFGTLSESLIFSPTSPWFFCPWPSYGDYKRTWQGKLWLAAALQPEYCKMVGFGAGR